MRPLVSVGVTPRGDSVLKSPYALPSVLNLEAVPPSVPVFVIDMAGFQARPIPWGPRRFLLAGLSDHALWSAARFSDSGSD